MKTEIDAAVIGSGPNGLVAAILLAKAGYSVQVFERGVRAGGGARTEELTLPGFRHDVCSAIHPMAMASPAFAEFDLSRHGLEWLHPDFCLAHPLDGGRVAILERSLEKTLERFDRSTARAYRRLFAPLIPRYRDLLSDLLGPPSLPRHPLTAAYFGLHALPSALAAARAWFSDEGARALLAGNAAHAVLPLDTPISTNAIGLMLMLVGHAEGWPLAKGGSESIIQALVAELQSHGGSIVTDHPVRSLSDLPSSRVLLFDTSPKAMAEIAGERLPSRYVDRLKRFRHGEGVFKIDYALSEPVPWIAEECRRAGTVHLGGGLDEIVRAESEVGAGLHPQQPFVLAAQQSLFDSTRAPEGRHTFWCYCHVPPGSTMDMTDRIEVQIERFAPGFRDCVLARRTMNCADYEQYNPNLIGGDIVGGSTDWRQLLTRPTFSLRPHETPNPDFFLCSASTPPGAGVHGMCGWWAAKAALRRL